jgi:hypothetical protein|tara:strand:+ start:401 stop:1261 length:861 start_codon:yes stop_codon:yes gene_type:complete
MAITGQQSINIGLPNESTGSDSLYIAFTKTNTNFSTLFANASSFTSGNGIAIANSVISANLVAGNNVSFTTDANGAITIDAISGGNGSSITSVVAGTGLAGGGSSGNITLNLSTSGVTAATYTNPTLIVDAYGKITSASNNVVSGTVTSVNLTAGAGVSVAGGPITSNGSITVTNTGVTRLNAGAGIALNAGNGNVTVSATGSTGTVQSVGLTSDTLTITGGPITSIGDIDVEFNKVPVYTIATKPGSGVVGMLIAISDSPTNAGKMAYWDTTNTRWSYVSDDSAV